MRIEAGREHGGRERERELGGGGERDRSIEQVRHDRLLPVRVSEESELARDDEAPQDRRLENERGAPRIAQEPRMIGRVGERLVGRPRDGAATEVDEIDRGDRLLDVARRDRRERGEAPPRFGDRPRAVRIEPDLERHREARAHRVERGDLAIEAGVVAGAELDLDRPVAEGREGDRAIREIVRWIRDQERVDRQLDRRGLAAEQRRDGKPPTTREQIEQRGLEREASARHRLQIGEDRRERGVDRGADRERLVYAPEAEKQGFEGPRAGRDVVA